MTNQETRQKITYYKQRLDTAVEIIDELYGLGVDYTYFMNAQSTHNILGKIRKLIKTI